MFMRRLVLTSLVLLAACSRATPTPALNRVRLYATPSTQAWLDEAFVCAEQAGAVIERVSDPVQADVMLRIGEPPLLASPAYQIDTEEVWIVAARQSSLQNLTLEEARRLFAGRGDPSIQIWAYAADEDVQRVFDQVVMSGRGVPPSARLAAGPQHMLEEISRRPEAVGILPRRWASGEVRALYVIPAVPVLALTRSEPQGALQALLSCLQSRRAV